MLERTMAEAPADRSARLWGTPLAAVAADVWRRRAVGRSMEAHQRTEFNGEVAFATWPHRPVSERHRRIETAARAGHMVWAVVTKGRMRPAFPRRKFASELMEPPLKMLCELCGR